MKAQFNQPHVQNPPAGPQTVLVSQNEIANIACQWVKPLNMPEFVECRVILKSPLFAPGQFGMPGRGRVRFVAHGAPGSWHWMLHPFNPVGPAHPESPVLTVQSQVPVETAFTLLWKPMTPGRPNGLQFEILADRQEGQMITHVVSWTGPELWPTFVNLVPASPRNRLFMRPQP